MATYLESDINEGLQFGSIVSSGVQRITPEGGVTIEGHVTLGATSTN